MRSSSANRPPSLAPFVREEAAIAQPGDSPSAAAPAGLPGAIYTPTGDQVSGQIPSPPSQRSTFSHTSNPDSHADLVKYKITLADVNKRSYYLIHEADATWQPHHPNLAILYGHLSAAVLLANLEVCIIRSWQLTNNAGRPHHFLVDLQDPVPGEDGAAVYNAAELEQRRRANAEAMAPLKQVLPPAKWCTRRHDITVKLEEQIHLAERALTTPALKQEICASDGEVLRQLAYLFAAYQPAVLDEDIKGSQSPYDARSHTRTIKDVRRQVSEKARDVGVTAPGDLAALAMKVLRTVVDARPDTRTFSFGMCLLQSAFMSGYSELAERLLDARLPSMYEMDIIRCLTRSWLGYRWGKLLQEKLRSGAERNQTTDWLDFRCSCPRAVLIAHKVIETVIAREDHDMTQSLQLGYTIRPGGSGPAAADVSQELSAAPQRSSAAGSTTVQPGVGEGGDGGVSGSNGQALASSIGGATNGASAEAVVRAAAAAAALSSPPRGPGGASALTSLGAGLLDESKEAELSAQKWKAVVLLFRRSAACKPLSIAILHVVVTGKSEINRLWREKKAAAAEGAAHAGEVCCADGALPPPADSGQSFTDEDDKDIAREAAAERARQEEAERSRRYYKLHRLAVQACHLAVHAGSLSTVADAITCIRAVRAWPAIDLEMLNDLAEHFPQQCGALLEAVPLQVVEMEDNVLPFDVPPGFVTVAVSNKDAAEFGQSGVSGSTQDAEHFATQTEEDVSIDTSLLVSGRAWLALLFLFWPSELRNPTSRKLLRVASCALSAFLWQGPGSIAVAAMFMVLLAVLGFASRMVVTVFRIVWWGILARAWEYAVRRYPVIGKWVSRIRGNQATATGSGGVSTRIHPAAVATEAAAVGNSAGGGGRAGGDGHTDAGSDSSSDDGSEEGLHALTANLGRGLWQGFIAHGHNAVIDGALGWGRGAASISCRKVPIAVPYAPEPSPDLNTTARRTKTGAGRTSRGGAGGGAGASHAQPRHRQLDTCLLEKLLRAPGVPPSVFGSKVLRALILFKWNFFTKYFIILQFLLHITYMGIFLAYAFTIKDMDPVDGREKGPGAGKPGCQLQEPTRTQIALLSVLAVMTVDFVIQEVRQICHFGLLFFTQAWDLLDVCSVALVVASIVLHFSCTSGVSPLTLRGLASVQIVLLFMRLLYYAMASDKLGSFVRMVLETTYDLMMFFAFLSVVFVGFALAIIISQGALADEQQTFIKLFTMMYGDFDVDFLSSLDSGALGLDALTRVLASLYMIIVTIILLNLLISIISESYERIRENERWESLRNKALLVVESETQLYGWFLTWLYSTLTAPPSNSPATNMGGHRYLYIITPEYARRAAPADDDEEDDDGDEEEDDEEDEDDGQWNGRLGEMKRHITTQGRVTLDVIRKEVKMVCDKVHDVEKAMQPAAVTAEDEVGVGAPAGTTVGLDERALQLITEKVGAVVGQEIQKLRGELLLAAGRAPQAKSQGRNLLGPLPNIPGSGAAPAAAPAAATRSRPEAGSAPLVRSAAATVGDSAPLGPQGSA